MTIRLAIAEDQRMVRELLSALLAREPGVEIVGEASTGLEAIDLASDLFPDVLLLDISMPGLSGIEVARILKKRLPGMKLLALSMHSDKYFVQQMLKAGADGYLVKSSAVSELVHAIRVVVEGKVYLSPDVARATLREHLSVDSEGHKSLLSSREQQVLALLADGKRSAEIGAELHISAATVEAHRAHIMRKLGLHTIAELTKYAIRRGLTSL
jgi:two-component system, NarL family, response regulator NreC